MDNMPKFDQSMLSNIVNANVVQASFDQMIQPQLRQQERVIAEIQKQKREKEQLEEKRHSELLEEAKQSNALSEEQNSKLEEQKAQLLDLNNFLKQKLTDTELLLTKANDELDKTKSKIDSVNCNLEFILQSIGTNSQLLLKDTGEIKKYVEELSQSISQNDLEKAKSIITRIFGEYGYDNINIILQIIAIACGFFV